MLEGVGDGVTVGTDVFVDDGVGERSGVLVADGKEVGVRVTAVSCSATPVSGNEA